MPVLLFPLVRRQTIRSGRQVGNPCLLLGMRPLPYAPPITIVGITKDSTGTPLGNCQVQVFEAATDRYITEVISDAATGAYTVYVGIGTGPYYLVAYKVGSPDVAGTTVNVIAGA